MGSPHVHTLLAGLEADVAEELEEGVKEMMKQLVLGLVGNGKKIIAEQFYHFRVKQMYQQAGDGENRYKVEIGLNLFGDYDMELKDFDGNQTQVVGQGLGGRRSPQANGATAEGFIERQLSKHLDKGWIGGGSWSDKTNKDGKDAKKKGKGHSKGEKGADKKK